MYLFIVVFCTYFPYYDAYLTTMFAKNISPLKFQCCHEILFAIAKIDFLSAVFVSFISVTRDSTKAPDVVTVQ